MEELMKDHLEGKEISLEDLNNLVEFYKLLIRLAHDSGGKLIKEWWTNYESGDHERAGIIMSSLLKPNAKN